MDLGPPLVGWREEAAGVWHWEETHSQRELLCRGEEEAESCSAICWELEGQGSPSRGWVGQSMVQDLGVQSWLAPSSKFPSVH